MAEQKVFYIPNGPKNLAALFPAIDFKNVQKYYIEVQDNTGTPMATTTISELRSQCCVKNKMRVFFLNYLGTWDAVNFILQTNEHEAKSDATKRSTTYPLQKTVHATNRFNVTANDTISLICTDYEEDDMKWITELIDSPVILSQWSGIQGQQDSYLPLVMQDLKQLSYKQDDRWLYEIIIQVKPSHDRFIIRN